MPILIPLALAAVVFLAGNTLRVVQFIRLPLPLRWELYPIPKGPRERQQYGGSYFEESEWWNHEQRKGYVSELRFVLREVLMLKSVRDSFRALWLWSWLFHWGLYLYAAAALAVVGSVLVESSWLRTAGIFGCGLACSIGLAGSVGVLALRLWHPRLRGFTSRSSVFDLVLLAVLFATGVLASPAIAYGTDLIIACCRVSPAGARPWLPFLVSAHVWLVAIFLAYFPFTHMTHAYMKFFSWHGVRWDDSPAMRDRRVAPALNAALQRTATWAAPHIAGDGAIPWAEVMADPDGKGNTKHA